MTQNNVLRLEDIMKVLIVNTIYSIIQLILVNIPSFLYMDETPSIVYLNL